MTKEQTDDGYGLPLSEYQSPFPVPVEQLMEEVARYQAAIDSKEGEIDEHREAANAARKEQDRLREKLALIGRARRNGQDLYMLNGGELTKEQPRETRPSGPLFDATPAAAPESAPVLSGPGARPDEPEAGTAEDLPAENPQTDPEFAGLEADGLPPRPSDGGDYVLEATCPDGKIARVRDNGDGTWSGRIDGIPHAMDLPTRAECCVLIENVYPNLLWGWVRTDL